MSRVLLASPAFHGYWKAIVAALQARGHVVTVHLYDELATFGAKVNHKVVYELPERWGRDTTARHHELVTQRAVQALSRSRPDAVIVVKGDQLGDDFWSQLADRPRVLWLYDELRRTQWQHRSLTDVGPIYSYSKIDTAELTQLGLPARHLPLAFDHRLRPHPTLARTDETVFIGARYPNRQHAMELLAAHDLPVRAFGRDWSHHAWDRLRTWDMRRRTLPAGRDLDRGDAYDTMTAARATLNIHGDQDGFTMRTFEACGVGALQFIDRADLEGLYDDGVDLASYSSEEELVDLCQRAATDLVWAARLRASGRARTLAEHTFDHRVAILEESWV